MSFNGSGTFAPFTPGNPVISGTVISSTAFNATITDIAAGLTNAVTRDGQSPPTANLPMGGRKHTGLAAGVVAGESLRFEQLFSQGAPATLPSAATVDIGGQNSVAVEISGTTGITSFGTNYNGPRFLRFAGALTLTHSATLSLPGAANITTVAGDTAIAYPNSASSGWNVVSFNRAAYAALPTAPAASGAVTGSGITMATARLLGRTTAVTGAIEELALGRGLVMAAGVLQTVDSSFQLNTANGYGSTSNVIRLFTNIADQRGSFATDYTVSNSATLGSTITINTADYYTFNYSESNNGSTATFGLSLNSTQLSTQIVNITLADRLILGAVDTTSGVGFTSVRAYFAAGSVVRPHTAAIIGGTAALVQLRVSRG